MRLLLFRRALVAGASRACRAAMRTVVTWSDRVPEKDGVKSCVYDIAFRPDGTQLVAAVGSRVLVYDCADGDLLHTLKGHKKTLYCVAYARDGKRFASGGEDKTIIIWTSKAEGILKYSHNDSIQCLCYNGVTQQLASGTASDFGLWSPEQKSVAKHKVSSRILCMSWCAPLPTRTRQARLGPLQARCRRPPLAQDERRHVPDAWDVRRQGVLRAPLAPSRRARHLDRPPPVRSSRRRRRRRRRCRCHAAQVSLRDAKTGSERTAILRNAPVWTLEWNPSRDETPSLLAIGCWDQTLSFYDVSGQQHGRDRALGHDPACVSHFANGEYLCVGGSDRKATLWTKEGVRLTTIAERDDWVWCCVPRPNANYVAIGCNDGSITMYQLVFSTVHGLYRERYAYREYMTDVIVQNMVTESKVRIKCRAYVRKIAIYKDRLIVQLPERLCIYELLTDEASGEMTFRPHERLNIEVKCNLLVVVSLHFLLCVETKLQLYSFAGARLASGGDPPRPTATHRDPPRGGLRASPRPLPAPPPRSLASPRPTSRLGGAHPASPRAELG